jgi:type II secretory ATPase GspE/PulE/Tfp pilus assembly ATPase PilB-like protein
MEAAPHPWPTLGVLLMRDGLVSKEDLEAILDEQRDTRQQRMSGHRLGEILIRRGAVTSTQVAKLVAEQYELPFVDLNTSDIDVRVARLLSEELARRFSAVPVNARADGSHFVAIADPATVLFSDELRGVLGSPLHFAVVGPDAIEAAIAFVHDRPYLLPVAGDSPDAEDPYGIVLELRPEESTTAASPGEDSNVGALGTGTHLGPPLGAMLMREGILSREELEGALAQQRLSTSWRLGEILVNRGIVTPSVVARLIAEQYELPFVELADLVIDSVAAARLPREIAREFPAVPIAAHADGSLEVAIADPTNVYFSGELHRALGVPLTFVVAAPDAIDAVLESVHAPITAPELDTQELADAEAEVEVAPAGDAYESIPVEDAREPTDHQDDLPEFVEEVVPVADVVSDDELGPLEETVERLPTWTTELQLTSDEVELAEPEADRDDEPETIDTFADDLTTALLAEITGSDELTETPAIDQAPEVALALVEFDHDEGLPETEMIDETPEPAATVALIEHDRLEQATGSAELPDEHVELDTDDLDAAIKHALTLGASAIHFSPQGDWHTVRARIDGLVRELGVVGQEDLESLVERVGTSAAMRVDVMPTKQGDKVTLFPREQAATPIALADLGATGDAADAIHEALAMPSGATLVCGPVGSGTTTTLYAALDVLNTPDRVVATVEDPVDRLLDGVDQVEIDEVSGVTFASGLRALLANDSDAVLVGEIRDRETAEVAFQAALTGRHVLSALRVSSAAAAIRRLVDMGLEPSVVGGALTCVVAQRLVRRVCADCRETYYATEPELAELGQPLEGSGPRLLARGRGCETCDGTGFRGRVGIFEVLRVTDEIRALVSDGASVKKIHRAAVAAGMQTLREDGVRLCLEGVTTAAEMQRILGTDH